MKDVLSAVFRTRPAGSEQNSGRNVQPASLMNLKSALHRFWLEWLRPLLTSAAIILPLKSAIADINFVPTGSMMPTILPGDFIFVNKLAYDLKVPFTTWHLSEWVNPSSGDVVVCLAPVGGIR